MYSSFKTSKYIFALTFLAIFLSGCKTSQPITKGGGDDKGGKDDGKSDIKPAVFTDPEVIKFGLDFAEYEGKYETFEGILKPQPIEELPKDLKPASSINDKIDEKLGTIRYMNGDINKIMGYRILIYTGSELSEAKSLERKLKNIFGSADVDLKYKAPNYTLKAGEYFTRLKAHEVYTKLKEEFPQAIVVSEVIEFDREKFKRQ